MLCAEAHKLLHNRVCTILWSNNFVWHICTHLLVLFLFIFCARKKGIVVRPRPKPQATPGPAKYPPVSSMFSVVCCVPNSTHFATIAVRGTSEEERSGGEGGADG